MWDCDDLAFSPEKFSGIARLFPLPGHVMFPHVMQPLHIFEPRYREMVEDALVGDRLVALATLRPGYEEDYEGRPPIAPIACLGRIVSHQRHADGRLNILLLGLERIRIDHELQPLRSFRQAEVLLCPNQLLKDGDQDRSASRAELLRLFRHLLPHLPDEAAALEELLSSELPLDVLTDIVSYALDLDMSEKEALLAEPCVDYRTERLIRQLRLRLDPDQKVTSQFPPLFSYN